MSESFETPWTVAVHGILQVRTLEWAAISFSRGSSRPRDQSRVSCLGRRVLSTEPPGSPLGMCRCTFDICWMNSVQELRGQNSPTALGSHGEEGSPILSGQGGCPHPRKASAGGTPPQPMHYANASKWMFSLSDLKHCARTDPVNLLCQGGLAEQPAKEAQFPSLPMCV